MVMKHLSALVVLFASSILVASTTSSSSASKKVIIDARMLDGGKSAEISVQLPAGVHDSIKIHLNGKDVSSRFSQSDCGEATCESATLTSADGLRLAKNVVALVAGDGVTGRLRFGAGVQEPSATSLVPRLRSMAATGKVQPHNIEATSYLTPTISFNTIAPGGWTGGTGTWFTVGSQGYPSVTPNNCSGAIYLVLVLDRFTLEEKTAAPESSSTCYASAGALKAFLTQPTLSANDLIVVGTVFGQNADAGLDLSAIGGTNFTGAPPTGYPAAVMAIGVPGAAAGSAYTAYYLNQPGYEQVDPFANGTLQEDAYGNYNFQSSDVVEFAVSPNDPSIMTSNTNSVIMVETPPSLRGSSPLLRNVYTAPADTNGYWMLVLSRYSLQSNTTCNNGSVSPTDPTTGIIPGCGTFYATGSSDSPTSLSAYRQLASDLSSINSWQIAFLTTVGQAAYGGPNNTIWDVGGFNGSTSSTYPTQSNGFLDFSNAIAALGGAPNLTQSLLSPTSAYTFISSPGIGGPLTGNSVESTTTLQAQGQSGFVHGIMQRNINGLFMPQQTNQEPVVLYQAKGLFKDTEFSLTKTALQQPATWPSSSQTTLLSGASSLSGQFSAYQYLSYILLSKVYRPGLQSPYLGDIHYFFSSSYNTTINYHYYDPGNIQFPAPGVTGLFVYPCDSYTNNNTECTVTLPGVGTGPLTFTSADFNAVLPQLRQEVIYLTDTLNFLVTGSTNMKDVISSGSANAGLALTGAGATILGSALNPPPPTTVVTTSWQNIVGMIGGVSSLLSAVPGLGEVAGIAELATTGAKIFGGLTTAIGGAATIAASAGQITSSSSNNALPSAFAGFSTTIGQLANSGLQGQLDSGFDTLVDDVTSDWGRLSTIEPLTENSSDTVFFSPSQTAQSLGITSLTQGASRSFYIALMPTLYNVHYWPGVQGFVTSPAKNIPDMGYSYTSGDTIYCKAYYITPQENGVETGGLGTPVPNTYVWYPTPAGTTKYFIGDSAGTYNGAATAIDMYVIAGLPSSTNTTYIAPPDPTIASYLFTNAGINLPIDEFVAPNGPMANKFVNAALENPLSHEASSMCPSQNYPYVENGQTLASTSVAPQFTTTVLAAPALSTLGADVSVSAAVTSASTAVTKGTVFFTVDDTYLAHAAVDGQGGAGATLSASALTLGTHQIRAWYYEVAPYAASASKATSLNIYATAPDLNLSASASSLNVSYGATSSPLTLQLTSLAGLSGTVNLACSGLPVGMTCSFNPAEVSLSSGGRNTASLTITATAVKLSSLPSRGLGLIALPASLIVLAGIGRGRRHTFGVLGVLLLSLAGFSVLSGCSSGTPQTQTQTLKESGTKTILISASSGAVTRSIPLQVNIQ